ncbi:hypothetical protein FOPG_14051 [Fusarium oxysporum f. sp. conglutinans race 2 54008]|uniref:Uncharacterized protein n=2 Tax=Fusarium oxysporum TaxID=5507 RepID=X0MFX8_FUSOX|nr:hypothetical protein FOPG_14051 [Fusarium oxysporum f. sp. conglutinans race 2 54008]EXM19465.1 hypothetical protein FOTG_12516 [Fusarium oxysporum f. sp. vasinfectum 25433]KAI8395647.1 hypothetical protein FOFC_21177 [Fusarium oxysporum]
MSSAVVENMGTQLPKKHTKANGVIPRQDYLQAC